MSVACYAVLDAPLDGTVCRPVPAVRIPPGAIPDLVRALEQVASSIGVRVR